MRFRRVHKLASAACLFVEYYVFVESQQLRSALTTPLTFSEGDRRRNE